MSVEEITQSLESSCSLAHADTSVAEPVNLRRCVQNRVDSLQWDAVNKDLAIHNQVLAWQEWMLVRHTVMMEVRNIVRNAIAHASPAILAIQSSDDGLELIDTGPGIGPKEQMLGLSAIFLRGAKRQAGKVRLRRRCKASPAGRPQAWAWRLPSGSEISCTSSRR